MLKLNNIRKSYTTGDFKQVALDDVSLNFRENEFVAILGQSGSGKTTLLNVIGGLDKYDSGDLILNEKSTKEFKDKEWDAYRNNSVGFVFQNYNLISHLSVLDNVEMGMTLSGLQSSTKHAKAIEVLERVGLKDHIHKKPNQLSGGQMQRVAIARALANNPDIILADEPTGALDSDTSEQIMELIKEIAKDKLVIMVTHNPDLAERYSNRIVRLSDGKVISDSNPYNSWESIFKKLLPNSKGSLLDTQNKSEYKLKMTSMSFLTALKLSGKNILTKKWRTILTAFASSIGIIGIALVLSLSNGFDKQISEYETNTLSNYPITINKVSSNFIRENNTKVNLKKYPKKKIINSYDTSKDKSYHVNNINQKYLDYIEKMDQSLLNGISYTRSVNMNILKKVSNKAVSLNTDLINFGTFPGKPNGKESDYLKQYYDLLEGEYPKSKTDLVLVIDEYNRLDLNVLNELGVNAKDKDRIDLSELIGKEYKLIFNNDYYIKEGNIFTVNGVPTDLSNLYKSDQAITLKISGVIRLKENSKMESLPSGIAYSDSLAQYFIDNASNSDIVKAQKESNYSVLTGTILSESSAAIQQNGAQLSMTKDDALAALGSTSVPASVALYPVNFDSKEKILNYLDDWNKGLKDKEKIQYTDLAALITKLSKNIMEAITIVLVAFAAISLVVSLIMIGIIIYISVLERTKEIGVLRALGARKKDITRVFNAETFIIGLFSGLLGIGIAFILTFPVNHILYNYTQLTNVAQLNPLHALILVLLSLILTMLGGFIPAKMAAKKDPVEALRSE